MHVEYRKCTAKDLEALVEISLKTFVDAFEKDNNPEDFRDYINVAFAEKTILEQLSNPNSSFYFLYLDQQLAGYYKLNEYDAQSELMADDIMELERIYVLSAFQNKGLGAFMLNEAIQIAINKKKKSLWLGVWQENNEAVRFYEKHGFVKFGTHPYYIGKDRQTDWLMQIVF